MKLEDQILCVEREVGMRISVYAHRVKAGKMTREKADHEVNAMIAVLETLRRLREFHDGLE